MIPLLLATWMGLAFAPPSGDSPKQPKSKKQKDDEDRVRMKFGKLDLRIGARLMTGWQVRDSRPVSGQSGTAGTSYGFFLQQARPSLDLRYAKVLRMNVSAELSDALDSPSIDKVPYLRNAYANVRIAEAFQIRAGHFKRPFSALELEGTGSLPFRGRGLANGRIVEDRGYGARGFGAMVWGNVSAAKMEWYAGVFDAALHRDGVDAIGRLKFNPTRWLGIGGSGGFKHVEDDTGKKVNAASASGDVTLKAGEFRMVTDVVAGQDYLVPGLPWALGVVGFATYDFDLPKGFVLRSVTLVEWADANAEVLQSESLRVLAGLNVNWKRSRVRMMPQVEFIRPLGTVTALNPWIKRDTFYLMLSVEL